MCQAVKRHVGRVYISVAINFFFQKGQKKMTREFSCGILMYKSTNNWDWEGRIGGFGRKAQDSFIQFTGKRIGQLSVMAKRLVDTPYHNSCI